MLMFREEKSPEDEIKAWQFWHGRQHSVKQRILDAGKIISSFVRLLLYKNDKENSQLCWFTHFCLRRFRNKSELVRWKMRNLSSPSQISNYEFKRLVRRRTDASFTECERLLFL